MRSASTQGPATGVLFSLGAGIKGLHNRATAVERAALFKSGLNYLCVGESGIRVRLCTRTYDGNGHFTGYAARNYQWQWPEVDRLAFVWQLRWQVGGYGRGYPVLFAWPAPGYVPVADDHNPFREPAQSYSRLSWHGWPPRQKTWLTGVRWSRHADTLMDDLTRWARGNWRVLRPPDLQNPQDEAWPVCAAPLFRRRRWRTIDRAVRRYSAGRAELDMSALARHALAAARSSSPPLRCGQLGRRAGHRLSCVKEARHRGRHRDATGRRFSERAARRY
jgi:hypothetical protein